MRFEVALTLLKAGIRVIRKKTKENYDQLWLALDCDNQRIVCMGEPWDPDPEELNEYLMADDWEIVK